MDNRRESEAPLLFGLLTTGILSALGTVSQQCLAGHDTVDLIAVSEVI